MKYRLLTLLCLTGTLVSCGSRSATDTLQQPRLFVALPAECPTPDGMATDAGGNLVNLYHDKK